MSTTKKKKIDSKKLALKKETLRELSQDQLDQVNGGRKELGMAESRWC